MTFIAGIDEAGRGPLVGSLFMAIVVIDEEKLEHLRSIGVRDSKALSRVRRSELFGLILGLSKLVIASAVPPQVIDRENLNLIEMKTVCRLLSKAFSIVNIDRIYIDAFADPDKIKSYFTRCLGEEKVKSIVVEHQADKNYIVVGAASIVAKVLRDSHIEILKKYYGDFGSGYPSDSKTIEWLKSYYHQFKEIPPIVRRSWKTVEKIIGFSSTLDRYLKKRPPEGGL